LCSIPRLRRVGFVRRAAMSTDDQSETEALQSDPVLYSCLQMAAVRAMEGDFDNPLFEDSLARSLAGAKANEEAKERALRHKGKVSRKISVRTRFFDDFMKKQIEQVVVLGCGMDTRYFRLNLTSEANLKWFEIDLPVVIHARSRLLGLYQPGKHERRIPICADLADADWGSLLAAQGFNPEQPTTWVLEGLLMYLEPSVVDRLANDLSRLSAVGSAIVASSVDTESLTAARESSSRLQQSWRWGVDDPAAYFQERLGTDWSVTAAYMGQVGSYPLGANYEVWRPEDVLKWRRKGKTFYTVAKKRKV